MFRKGAFETVETCQLQELDRTDAILPADASRQQIGEEDVVERCFPLQQCRPLEHHADLGAGSSHIIAEDRKRAGGALDQTGDQP